MDIVTLSQIQFATTSIYHFFFVPLTLGLILLVAIMETIYVRTGNEIYKKMTKFWGKLFLINFAMGVVTGIVQEFQFGMNWSQYSRYVGDIFGAPLAIEALTSFFLESTFLGVWIFGWDRLSKKLHLASIWLAALGSTVSALWILIANSFMQNPVGFKIEAGRAVMTDFSALVFNPNVWIQFPHTILGGYITGAFFVLGISAWHIARKKDLEFFGSSFKIAAIFGIIAAAGVGLFGHAQGQHIFSTQPMKMAAAEALWKTQDPAPFTFFAIIDEHSKKDVVAIGRVPAFLTLLAYNSLTGEVKGIEELQATYEKQYGPGNYIPPINMVFWTFRLMVGAGFLMIGLMAYSLYWIIRKHPIDKIPLLKFAPLAIILPFVANTSGWLLTEMGRQPWLVFGLLKTRDAVSPNLTPAMVTASLVLFVLIYGGLMVVDVYLLAKFARNEEQPEPVPETSQVE